MWVCTYVLIYFEADTNIRALHMHKHLCVSVRVCGTNICTYIHNVIFSLAWGCKSNTVQPEALSVPTAAASELRQHDKQKA